MPLILNIETSSDICSVSLSKGGNSISIKESKENNSHSKLLTILIEEILFENNFKINDVDTIAVSEGPGSYTGLRIGVSTAKGICYALNKPLIAVNTLQSLAINIFENSHLKQLPKNEKKNILICPMIDARRMEVYTGFFDINYKIKNEIKADIITSDSYKDILSEHIVLFGGSGSEKCMDLIRNEKAFFIHNISFSAKYMTKISYAAYLKKEFVNTAYFEPFYLKEFVAGVPKRLV